MNKTIEDRVNETIAECKEINMVEIDTKCKTLDDMIYTIRRTECRFSEKAEGVTEGQYAESIALQDLLDCMSIIDTKEDGFALSTIENCAIRKSQIAKIWSTVGAFHADDYDIV